MTTTHTAAKAAPPKTDHEHTNLVFLFIGLMLTMLLASLNQTVLSTALPTIVGELNGADHMAWVITAYILASTIVMPIYGRISDIFGRRAVILGAIAIFIIGSIVGGLAGDMPTLIVARVIQGLGGGGLMILSQAAIADVVPARERGKYMGIMGAVFAVSSVAGPLLGGWLTEGPGWRWAFWLNVPFGALAFLAALVFLKLPKRAQTEKPRIDYLGMILLAGATTSIVLLSTWGGTTYEWGSWQIISLGVAAVVLGVLFVFAEKRAQSPVIPLSLFRDRNFNLTTTASLLTGVAMFGTIGYMPTYLQMVTGVDAQGAGLLMIPMMGALLITSTISGAAVSRSGRYKAYPIIGSAVIAIGMVFLSRLPADAPIWLICTVLGIIGIGIGLGMQILTLIVQNAFPVEMVGTATAANNYFRQVGASLGSAIVGSIFTQRLMDILTDKLSQLPAGAGSGNMHSLTPAAVNAMPDAIRDIIVSAYNEALLPIFIGIAPLAVLAMIVLFFIQEKELATTIQHDQSRVTDAATGGVESSEWSAAEIATDEVETPPLR